ncbi:sulfatase-like hydrolase/transferase [Virgibacillus oceani]|uniref:Choline-sulfatase n=1 Tax=Virgibacillus oceani TaxID=1479511 RepID=A0A917M2J2_9BACI|nr:sulfatase-like hydrolase/transferase [Virgibacillus oceani]GGG72792.1 choline-sulfatase [Virgibacillus oceani]
MEKNMNVVFIMTDQQRADVIGENRHPCADFPNMEQLKRESVSFANFFTAASPCVPSRHTFLTGRQPWRNGVSGNRKFSTEGETTWMQLLREYGYRCVSVGKTHMVHAGSFHIPVPVGKSFGEQDGWNHFNPEASPESDDNYYDIHVARRACDALERLNDTEPFAMFIGFHAPHEPYVMPEKYLDFCKPEDVPLPANRSADEYETKSEAYRRRRDLFKNMFGDMTEGKMRKGIAGHFCLLKMVDDCLGMINDKLNEKNLLENTLIVFASDHGELLGEHNLFNKAATAYESEIRVPFMIRYPDGFKAGENITGLASSIDFVPTLFNIMGLEPDVTLPGHSLVPSIEAGREVRDYVTLADGDGTMGIRTREHKLWYNANLKDGEMYDLINDPDEMTNLYNHKDFKELRSELVELMLHARMVDDDRDNLPTRREKLLHDEVKSSYEPEVV